MGTLYAGQDGENLAAEPYRKCPPGCVLESWHSHSKYLEYRDNMPALNNAKRTGYLSYAPTLDTIYAVHHGS